MTSPVFIKHYPDPARGAAAARHLRWLEELDSGVRLPHLYPGTATHLMLEYLNGRQPEPGDLPQVAAVLGRLHGAAHARDLHAARLEQPYDTGAGPLIADFHTSRQQALKEVGITVTRRPVAFYKDANLRNFVITATGPAVVDFDDLTLAPFGYDLAKLVLSTAMTHGHLPPGLIDATVHAYNHAVTATGGPDHPCSLADLAAYAEVHHLLTARYFGRNGYRHPWDMVRPWPPQAFNARR